MDGSFRRPGSIPFKWEIQPGVPKPYSSSSSSSPSPSPKPPPHTQKLAPPPPSKMINHYHNPSPPSFSSPWLLPLPPPSLPCDLREPSFFRRSSSVSPSKRRPTSKPAHASTDSPRPRQLLVGAPVSQGCFVMPSLRRNEEKKSFGGGGSGKFNYMAFRLPRRSASARSLPSHYVSPSYYFASSSSSSSSSSSTPSRKKDRSSSSSSSTPSRKKDGRERNDMKVATRWML